MNNNLSVTEINPSTVMVFGRCGVCQREFEFTFDKGKLTECLTYGKWGKVFPELTSSDCEFLFTGMCEPCMDAFTMG